MQSGEFMEFRFFALTEREEMKTVLIFWSFFIKKKGQAINSQIFINKTFLFFSLMKRIKNQDLISFLTLQNIEKAKLYKLARLHQGSNNIQFLTPFKYFSTKRN